MADMDSQVNVDALLAPTREQPPCGPYLQFDNDYLECERLARGKPEQQYGAKVIPAEPPRWAEVLPLATALLLRSKDLHIACLLLRALVGTRGFAGLLPGLRVLDGLLRHHWDAVHPRLDESNGNDATSRMNALAPLADAQSLLRELRDAAVVRSGAHGVVLVRDVEVALGRLAARAGTKPPTLAQLQATLAGAVAEQPGIAQAVADTLQQARALASLLDEQVGPLKMPDLKPLTGMLQALVQVMPAAAAPVRDGPVAPAPPDGGQAVRHEPTPVAAVPGEIRTRQDALASIDRIVAYLESHEPTNPAPLLLKRARRFMSMSFIDIVKEISPEIMAKVDAMSGPRDAT